MLKLQTVKKNRNENKSKIPESNFDHSDISSGIRFKFYFMCNGYNSDNVSFGRLPHICLTAQYEQGTLPHGNIFASLLDYMH